MAWIRSHHFHLLWKFKLSERKFILGNKAKHCWVMFFLHLKQTFLPIIWIFIEGEGYGIKSRLSFKIFSTLFRANFLSIFFSSFFPLFIVWALSEKKGIWKKKKKNLLEKICLYRNTFQVFSNAFGFMKNSPLYKCMNTILFSNTL